MANRFVLNETSYHGKGAINEIVTEAKARGFQKALVCSDPDLIQFGVTKKVTDLLDEAGLVYEIYSDIKANPTIENLAGIFRKSVLPLLQEYFYEDYNKIMMILGDNDKDRDDYKFILAKEIKHNSIFKGDISDVDLPDYSFEFRLFLIRYNFNFYESSLRKFSNFNAGSCRSFSGKIRSVNLIYRTEIVHIVDKDCSLDYIFIVIACSS